MNMKTKRVLFVVLMAVVLGAAFFTAYQITLKSTKIVETPAPAASAADETGASGARLVGGETTGAQQNGAAVTDAAGQSPESVSGGGTTAASDAAATTDAAVTTDAATEAARTSSSDPASPTYINGILIVNKSYAFPRSYEPGGLTSECSNAFYEMQAAAEEEGLDLWIASGFRSYETQSSLYQRYCNEDGQAAADTYSARPGHSEHETGLAIDLNDISSSFAYTAEGQWVAEHCWEYGFILRYPADKVSITGYMYEPWHIRYLGRDAAKSVYDSGLCLEEYLGVDSVYRD